MWDRFKHGYKELRDDEPGQRFIHSHDRWRGHTHGYAATAIIVVIGGVLIAGGCLLGFIPGLPGIVLVVLGGALIGTRFRRVAIWLDWIELKARKLWRWCRESFASR